MGVTTGSTGLEVAVAGRGVTTGLAGLEEVVAVGGVPTVIVGLVAARSCRCCLSGFFSRKEVYENAIKTWKISSGPNTLRRRDCSHAQTRWGFWGLTSCTGRGFQLIVSTAFLGRGS